MCLTAFKNLKIFIPSLTLPYILPLSTNTFNISGLVFMSPVICSFVGSSSCPTIQKFHSLFSAILITVNPQPFKRQGSYSSKIQTSDFFGIKSAAAIRSSWASNTSDNEGPSRSPSPSPRINRKSSVSRKTYRLDY